MLNKFLVNFFNKLHRNHFRILGFFFLAAAIVLHEESTHTETLLLIGMFGIGQFMYSVSEKLGLYDVK